MARTLEAQAQEIWGGTDTVDMWNEHVSNGVRSVLFLAALAFEDDGSLPDGDTADLQAIKASTWPFVKEQVALGIKALPSPAERVQWAQAVDAVYRVAEVEDIAPNVGGLF